MEGLREMARVIDSAGQILANNKKEIKNKERILKHPLQRNFETALRLGITQGQLSWLVKNIK